MRKLTIALAIVLWSASANAQGFDEETSLKIRNLIDDYIACYSYFKIVENGLINSGDADTAEGYKQGADNLLERVFILSDAINMKEETVIAKVDLETKSQIGEIDNDYVNISILLNKYSADCLHLHDNADQVLKERGLE